MFKTTKQSLLMWTFAALYVFLIQTLMHIHHQLIGCLVDASLCACHVTVQCLSTMGHHFGINKGLRMTHVTSCHHVQHWQVWRAPDDSETGRVAYNKRVPVVVLHCRLWLSTGLPPANQRLRTKFTIRNQTVWWKSVTCKRGRGPLYACLRLRSNSTAKTLPNLKTSA